MIDDIDRQILGRLQEHARTSNAEIARQLGMAPSAILERIRKLEARGVIRGYHADIDPELLGRHLTAFVNVTAIEPIQDMAAGRAMAAMPEVQEVHWIAGSDCYLVKVRVRDADDLGALIRDRFGAIEGMHRTQSTIVITTLKESRSLPLEAA